MATPRQQLATILILSAIDVLLCSFTAALTLFFIGAGADAANARRLEESAVIAEDDSRGAGAPAVIVIAAYDKTSARLNPAGTIGYTTMPAENWQAANPLSWFIEELPTNRNPFVLIADVPGELRVRLSLSAEASSGEFSVTCPQDAVVNLRIVETAVTSDNPSCKVVRQRGPR